jgi:hypothetical protein
MCRNENTNSLAEPSLKFINYYESINQACINVTIQVITNTTFSFYLLEKTYITGLKEMLEKPTTF